MAGATKRLRRKTTVRMVDATKGCSELMLLTSEWWMPLLLPVGRYMNMWAWRWNYKGTWIRVWRLLSKEWREVWDQGFRIKLIIHEACVSDLCHAARWYDDLKFSRDSRNRLFITQSLSDRFCIVTMPWKTFVGLRSFLTWETLMERIVQREFAQTAFCLQSEL